MHGHRAYSVHQSLGSPEQRCTCRDIAHARAIKPGRLDKVARSGEGETRTPDLRVMNPPL